MRFVIFSKTDLTRCTSLVPRASFIGSMGTGLASGEDSKSLVAGAYLIVLDLSISLPWLSTFCDAQSSAVLRGHALYVKGLMRRDELA
jgi:hypothetical protein